MAKDVKRKIIETSYHLYKEKGFDSVTVNDICDACSITKTTFYRYLSSKEDTLTYFFDNISDEFGSVIKNLATADNYWQQILAVFDLVLNRMTTVERDLYAQLWITNLRNYQGSFDEIPVLKEIVIVLIQKAQEAGQIHNPAPADRLYALCADICFGCAGRWAMSLEKEDIYTVFLRDIRLALMVDEGISDR